MTSERGSGEAPESAPDEPEQECEDGTFTSAIARLEEVSDTFNAAFQALETITCAEKQVSGITRKRLALRAVEKLEKTQAGASRLREDLLQLQERDCTQHAQMEQQRQENLQQAQELAKSRQQVMLLHDRMQQHGLVIQEHEQAAQAADIRAQEDAAYRLTLQKTIDTLNSDVMELQKRTQEAEASTERMAEEHAGKLKEMNEATAEARIACDKLDDAELRASQAGVSVDKAHQAVAKLSADNVVLLVKLRKAETRSSKIAEEVAVLRAAVDSQSGAWFEDIHATVERVTREGMQRADTLQAQMETQQTHHESRLSEASAERDRLAAHLATALDNCRQLEADFQHSRKEVKELKVEVKRKAEELASTTASLDAAAAETRVVGKEREQMKLEWTQMFSAHDSLVSRIKSLESQLSQTLKQAQEDRGALVAARKQIELERSVNRKLLQSKADVEYRLMEAQAQLPHSSPEAHARHHHMHGISATSPSATSPFSSSGHMQNAHPRSATQDGGNAAALPEDRTAAHVAGSGRSSPNSATGTSPLPATSTVVHPMSIRGFQDRLSPSYMRSSIDQSAGDHLRHDALMFGSNGAEAVPGSVCETHFTGRSSRQELQRLSPLQYSHSPVHPSGNHPTERLSESSASPWAENTSNCALPPSSTTMCSGGQVGPEAPVLSASVPTAMTHGAKDESAFDALRRSRSTASPQMRAVPVMEAPSHSSDGKHASSAQEQACSHSIEGSTEEFVLSTVVQDVRSSEHSGSHVRKQDKLVWRGSQQEVGSEGEQENSPVHANALLHL